MIGGLPITQVIVEVLQIYIWRKNEILGYFSWISSCDFYNSHSTLLNKIPLSVLAAVLLVVGYKLAKPALFKKMYNLGWKQFVPFTVTVLGIVFIDLLYGIGMGLVTGIFIILVKSFQNSHFLNKEGEM